MKKKIKRISVAVAVFVMAAVLSINAFAETVYEYYGLQYTLINNYSVSIYGRTDNSAELTIPNAINERAVADIANRAFSEDANLTSVSFAGARSLERIGMFAFKGCPNLSGNLVLPAQITTLETGAFQECASLSYVDIKAQVSELPSQVFYQCGSLSTVILNSNIRTIGSFAFAECPNLTYLELSRNITNISSTAFMDDADLVLGVWYDSYSYHYAKDKNISYVLLDGVKLGDVNGDGIININDVTAIQQHLAEYVSLEGIFLHAADADQNGEVKIDDATLLQEFLAEYTVGHPVGEVMTQ